MYRYNINFPITDSFKPPGVNQLHQEVGLAGCSDAIFEDIQNFFWGETDENLDEGELIKAAIARSMEEDIHPVDDMKLKETLGNFQKQVNDQETCEIVILRRKLLQTCLTAVKEPSFDYLKIPCIYFSGEEAEDLGGPKREFFRLLMKTVAGEFGVFEGNQSSLVFSHNHAVLEKKKPFITGQFVAWSLLHNGPGLHAMNEDTYYLMLQSAQHLSIPRAISALTDDEAAAIAKELFEATGDQSVEDIKGKHMNWFLDHGITILNSSKEDMCCQVIKESLYYRYLHFIF